MTKKSSKWFKKRGLSITLLLALALLLAACGGTPSATVSTATVTPSGTAAISSPAVSAEEEAELRVFFEDSMQKMQELNNFDAEAIILMDVTANGEAASTRTQMEITVFKNPLKVKMLTSADIGMGMSSPMSFSAYLEGIDDGGAMMYMDAGGQPMAQKLSPEEFAAQDMDIAGSLLNYMDGVEKIRKVGEEEVDGKELIHIVAILGGKALETAAQEAASRNVGLNTQFTEEQLQGIYEELPDIEVDYWFEKESGLIYMSKIDMSQLMSHLSDALGQEVSEASFAVSKMEMTMKISNLNEAEDFDIPASLKTP